MRLVCSMAYRCLTSREDKSSTERPQQDNPFCHRLAVGLHGTPPFHGSLHSDLACVWITCEPVLVLLYCLTRLVVALASLFLSCLQSVWSMVVAFLAAWPGRKGGRKEGRTCAETI